MLVSPQEKTAQTLKLGNTRKESVVFPTPGVATATGVIIKAQMGQMASESRVGE